MSEIVLENVSFYHGKDTPFEIKALKNIKVTIPHGKITGLIGHTGSGKSTLVNLTPSSVSINSSSNSSKLIEDKL